MQESNCCFIGHRKIKENDELKQKIYSIIENLIVNKKVDTFFFGSKSQFNDLCYEQVSKIKEKYPHIKRIFVRAEFLEITDSYKSYLLQNYEDTYYPEKIAGAGKALYVERNRYIIDKSHFCVICYQEKSLPQDRKSGTKSALDYAVKKGKKVIILS